MALTKVSTDGVKDDAITSGKIPANAVGASELADNVQTTITNQDVAGRLLLTTSTTNTIDGEDKLTWNDSNGLLSIKHGYNSGGGTGLLLFDTTSTGANEGMNIEWRSGTDKTSDQCRLGQYSNATGSGSNLDFYTNAGDSGVSNRRMRIPSTGGLVIGNDTNVGVYSATDGGSMMLTVQNDAASRTDAAISNQSTANNASAALVLAAHGQDFILESTGSGNTTDGAGAFRISDGTSERMRINNYGSIVRSKPSYAIYVTSMKTVSSSTAKNVQVLEDCYGQWLVVGKISNTSEMRGDMQSTDSLDTTNNQLTGDPKWSSLFGETYPSEVRYISASDWNNWRDTRVIDFIHGVPDDRKWKNFFTSGQSSGMPVVGSSSHNKRGWICAGAYDGFGRWRNPTFTNHKMMDSGQGGPTISETFFTTSGQTMNWYSGNTDAKIFARHNSDTGGQDDEITTGYGWDDSILVREDNFPNTAANGGGSDVGSYNLWICIKLGSPTFGHN